MAEIVQNIAGIFSREKKVKIENGIVFGLCYTFMLTYLEIDIANI